MEHRNTNNAGGGFILGILIGVLITLLFTTKKGRKILKTITDEGMDKINNFEDLFEKKMREEDDEDMGMSNEDVPSPVLIATHQVQVDPLAHQEEYHASDEVSSHSHTPIATGRRFFRGTPKRSN